MAKLFLCDVFRLELPHVYKQSGETCEVEGEQMVLLSHGAIVPITAQWHMTKSAATRQAAERVDSMIVEMVGLAARLRAEADAEEAKA